MRFTGAVVSRTAWSNCLIAVRNSLWLLTAMVLLSGLIPASAFTTKDVDTIASSYNSAFYYVTGTNGYIKDTQTGGIAYFWGQAEMIECVIDAYEWTSNSTYQVMITNLLNGFIEHNGANWSGNMYNDDIMWAVLAFARGGVATGKSNYIAIAKSNFDATYARAWDTKLGGGLYWTTDNNTKNACVNGPGSIAASVLFQIYGDNNYFLKASNMYYWERSVLFNTNSGAIADAIGTNGVINYWASTYNQGTFLGAAHFLGQTNDAALAAKFTMMNMTTAGVLPEYGIAGNNSGFNAIYLRWLMRYVRDRNLQNLYQPWLQINANAAWNLRRADNLSWCQWLHPSPMGTNFFSWDGISSFEIMHAAAPTQTSAPQAVPTDVRGYWPLNAGSGLTAADSSGNNNTGTLTNATWNASGRLGACLNFNGANSLVQITNTVCNDFSIAFWVKTTQTSGSPQWYNGVGLVDGDAPFNANDFGTALVGNKFAFGVGYPDTTIVSTSAINDGQWHHCVATRQQITGSIKVYVDGNLQNTGTGTRNSLTASSRLLLGAVASGNGYFNGSLDEVKIFTRTLSSNEVSALYFYNLLAPPAPPTNITAVVAGNAQMKLSWPETSLATGYILKRSLISGGPFTTLTNLTATTFTDTTALNSRTYYYVVSATNSIGESTNSIVASANTSTLVAWFKADTLTDLANGTSVSLWPDQTGNNYHAIQGIGSQQPTFVTNAINGQPAVRFNAANSSYLWLYRPVQDDFTMIFLFQSSQGLNTGTSFWDGAGLLSGEQNGAVSDFGISLNANGQVLAGTGNPDVTIRSGSGFNNGQPHVVTFKRTKSTGAIMLYMNGTLVASSAGGTQSLTAPNTLVLGAQGVLNNFLSGDIAEVQIYNSALSDTDRLGQERALRCRYGLSGGATPTVPLGLTGNASNRKISLNWQLLPGATDYNLWRSTNSGTSYELIASNLTVSSFVDYTAANGQINYYKVAGTSACGVGTMTVGLGIMLPLPSLGMNSSANTLNLTWPSWASDWSLFATTNLTPPIAWSPTTNAIGSNANGFSVSVPIGAGAQFFRLSSP